MRVLKKLYLQTRVILLSSVLFIKFVCFYVLLGAVYKIKILPYVCAASAYIIHTYMYTQILKKVRGTKDIAKVIISRVLHAKKHDMIMRHILGGLLINLGHWGFFDVHLYISTLVSFHFTRIKMWPLWLGTESVSLSLAAWRCTSQATTAVHRQSSTDYKIIAYTDAKSGFKLKMKMCTARHHTCMMSQLIRVI